MHRRPAASRARFRTTLEQLKAGKPTSTAPSTEETRRRHRSAWELIRGFFVLTRRQRGAMAFALATVTVSTLLGLIPPAVTKLIVDHVVGTEPWPADWPLGGATQPSRRQLLAVLLCGTLIVAFLRNTIHLWGRWAATRCRSTTRERTPTAPPYPEVS